MTTTPEPIAITITITTPEGVAWSAVSNTGAEQAQPQPQQQPTTSGALDGALFDTNPNDVPITPEPGSDDHRPLSASTPRRGHPLCVREPAVDAPTGSHRSRNRWDDPTLNYYLRSLHRRTEGAGSAFSRGRAAAMIAAADENSSIKTMSCDAINSRLRRLFGRKQH
uniref:Uncharacterized protein n=1 Tax=Globodera rostochiensis TaxID=31243 RepID=A0A914H9U6_GLORO